MAKKITQSIIEGSHAVALTIKNIKPDVISAYPITPQTHIVEDLAKFKADGQAKYEYVRAESEFAAASIIEGASAAGSRVYSATSSQGILLMTEVLFNIAGSRLPIVLTCANRGVSAPITIWNDHQDAMTVRDSGWIMGFAENHQEAVMQHILAYKVAEKLDIPFMVNIDGFVLTHSYEPVYIPDTALIKKYLPNFKAKRGQFLDPKNPVTFGAFATPAHYQEIRKQLHEDLSNSIQVIKEEYEKLYKTIPVPKISGQKYSSLVNNGLLEYYGPKKAKNIIICMGSVAGTVKEYIDTNKNLGLIKLRTFRPFPKEELLKTISKFKIKNIAVLEKAISLGSDGPLSLDVKTALYGETKVKIKNFIAGLGGRDINAERLKKIHTDLLSKSSKTTFIG